jgi:hypothetical protein
MGDRVREEWDETRLACAGLQNRAGPCSCHQANLLTFSAVQNRLLFANSILLRVILCNAKCMIYSPYVIITV